MLVKTFITLQNYSNNDENLYANFAAALSAQQQINQQFGQGGNPSAANQLLSLSSLPALNKILPNLPFPTTAATNLFQSPSTTNGNGDTLAAHTIASSKLKMCGFTAYVEQPERVDIVKIPAVVDEPLEVRIFIQLYFQLNHD